MTFQQQPMFRPYKGLAIGHEVDSPRHRLVLEGELDLATVGAFERSLGEAIIHGGELIVDLSRVTFADSMGLRAMLRCDQRCREHQCALAFAQPSEPVRRTLELSGLLQRLPFLEDGVKADAVKQLRHQH